MVSFTLGRFSLREITPRYPLDRRLGGPKSRSERFGEQSLAPAGKQTRGSSLYGLQLYHLANGIKSPLNCQVLVAFVKLEKFLQYKNILITGVLALLVCLGLAFVFKRGEVR
jgi:hypothetical protein